jgi:hypothetical protein
MISSCYLRRPPEPKRVPHAEFAASLNQRIHEIIEQTLAIRERQPPLLEEFGLSHQTELILVMDRLYEKATKIINDHKINELLRNPRTPQMLPKTLLEFYKRTITIELGAFAKKMIQ